MTILADHTAHDVGSATASHCCLSVRPSVTLWLNDTSYSKSI